MDDVDQMDELVQHAERQTRALETITTMLWVYAAISFAGALVLIVVLTR